MMLLGVCDTGFSSSLIGTMSVHAYKDFNSKVIEHGTNVLRAIKRTFNDCDLVLAGANLDSVGDVCSALRWLLNFDLQALNISWACREKNEEILHLLRCFDQKGARVFCAKSDKFLYPWSEFIGIGKEDADDEMDGINARGSSISCAVCSAMFMRKICENNEDKKHFDHHRNLEQLNLDI